MERAMPFIMLASCASCATAIREAPSGTEGVPQAMALPDQGKEGAAAGTESAASDDAGRTNAPLPVLEVPAPVVLLQEAPVNIVVLRELGYQVRIPEGWERLVNDSPENGQGVDIVLGHPTSRTTVTIVTYRNTEERAVTLDDVMAFHHYNLEKGGNEVGDEVFDANATGYVIEFGARRRLPGRVLALRVVGIRIHRVPGPVFVVIGMCREDHEAFMRAHVDEVIGGIEPDRLLDE